MKAGNKTNLRPHLSKGKVAHDRIIAGIDYHLVLKMPDVLNWVDHFGIVVES